MGHSVARIVVVCSVLAALSGVPSALSDTPPTTTTVTTEPATTTPAPDPAPAPSPTPDPAPVTAVRKKPAAPVHHAATSPPAPTVRPAPATTPATPPVPLSTPAPAPTVRAAPAPRPRARAHHTARPHHTKPKHTAAKHTTTKPAIVASAAAVRPAVHAVTSFGASVPSASAAWRRIALWMLLAGSIAAFALAALPTFLPRGALVVEARLQLALAGCVLAACGASLWAVSA